MAVRKRSFLYSALILTASGMALQLLGFAYKVFLGRVTGPEGMGVFTLVMPAYSVLMSFALSGLCTAVTALSSRQLALGQEEKNAQLVRMSLIIFFLLLAAVAVPSVLFSGWISEKILGNAQTQTALLLLIPCLALTGVENIVKSYFYGTDNVKLPAASDQMEQIVRIIAVVALMAGFRPKNPATCAALIVAGATMR